MQGTHGIPVEFEREKKEYTVKIPEERMYTGDEMRNEILRKLHRAETMDPRCHPDYDPSTRFSVQELLDHVVPHLTDSQLCP